MLNSNTVLRPGEKFRVSKLFKFAGALVIFLVFAFPLYWMLSASFMTQGELLAARPRLMPSGLRWENYQEALTMVPLLGYIKNTLIITAGQMLLQFTSSVLAAYAFSFGRFRGRNILFAFVLGAMMIPGSVIFVPVYLIISNLRLINTYAGLILVDAVSVFSIFLIRQAFLGIHKTYIEAGQIEGMQRRHLIFMVLLPMSKGIVITMVINMFMSSWNSYFWPKILTTKAAFRTIAMGVVELRQSVAAMDVVNYNNILAGAVISIVPIIILYIFLQKYIVDSISAVALK